MSNISISNILKRENILDFFVGFLIFLLCMPYFMWDTGRLNLIILMLIGIISVLNIKRISIKHIIIIIFFIFIFIYTSVGNNFSGFFFKLILLSFIIIQERKLLNILKWFKLIFSVSIFLSLITYILIVFLFIPINYDIIKPLNSLKTDNYILYPFLVSDSLLGFKYFYIRFFGIFDEPGVIGSYATLLLFIDNYNFKSKQNIILFIGGFLSFSLYFIISSLVFFTLTGNIKRRLFIISFFVIFFLLTKNNKILTNLIWDRLKIENGQLKGDNRTTTSLDAYYSYFLKSENVLFGKGNLYLNKYGEIGSSSYKELIINYGMFFFIFLSFTYIFWSYYYIKKPKYILIFLFLYFGMIYQRPFIFNPIFFFLFVVVLYQLKQNSISEYLKVHKSFK